MSLSTANTDNSQYSGSLFTDTSDYGKKMVGGIPFLHSGGITKEISRHRINKISNKYKMKGSRKQMSRRIKRAKSRLLKRTRFRRIILTKNKRSKGNGKSRHQRGGQYMSNVATNASYSTGGILSRSESALATPTPFFSNNVHGIENYNHFNK